MTSCMRCKKIRYRKSRLIWEEAVALNYSSERFRSLYGIRQSPNVNRLELSSMYRYEDLRGLSPVDLMRVYIAREKQEEDDWKFMKKQLENLHVKIEAHLDQKDPKERKRHCDMLKAGFEKTYQKEQ